MKSLVSLEHTYLKHIKLTLKYGKMQAYLFKVTFTKMPTLSPAWVFLPPSFSLLPHTMLLLHLRVSMDRNFVLMQMLSSILATQSARTLVPLRQHYLSPS